MTSLNLNTLVFQHLRNVSPDIALKFKSKHKCFSSFLTLSLTKIDVYKHLLQVTPELAKKFHKKHMVDQHLDYLHLPSSHKRKRKASVSEQQCKRMKDSFGAKEVITLTEEIIEVTSDSGSSTSDSDSDIDLDHNTFKVNPPKDCKASQVIGCEENQSPHEIIDVTSDGESSSSESDSNSDIVSDSEIVIVKEVNPLNVCKAKNDTTTNEDEKLFMQALEEQFNCVVTSSSSSSSESDDEVDVIVNDCVIKKQTVSKKQLVDKREPTNKINLVKRILSKHSTNDENMNAFRFILDCPEYNDLKRVLKEDSVVDKIVLYILNKNIEITQLNLENVILVSGHVYQSRHGDPCGVKIGSFTSQEIGIILSNWNTLVTEMKIKNPEETFDMFCKRISTPDKLKANVLGLYLSQGLPKIRLAADVFQHSKDKILARATGNITKEEHDYIMDYVSRHGESTQIFKDLAVLLNRGYRSELCLERYYIKNTRQKMAKKGKYTIAENKYLIKEIMSIYNIETVEEIKTLNFKTIKDTFTELAKNLGRSVIQLAYHWEQYIKPLLLKYHAGTINLDVKRLLVNHLLERNVLYIQDICWSDILIFPQFAGHTNRTLTVLYNDLIRSTLKIYQCKREEVTIEMVAEHVNDRFNPHKISKHVKQFSAQRLELADYYKSLLDKNSN